MTDRELITLPREVVQEAWEALAKTPCNSVYEQDCSVCKADEALCIALAAEKRHPGYVIGNHWFETAYERLCAGEAEDAILEDYELVREPRLRDLRRDAKRWRHWRDSHGFATIDHEKGRCFVTLICDCDDPDQVRAKRFAGEDSFEWLDAFTDAAMEASTAPASAAAAAAAAPEAKP